MSNTRMQIVGRNLRSALVTALPIAIGLLAKRKLALVVVLLSLLAFFNFNAEEADLIVHEIVYTIVGEELNPHDADLNKIERIAPSGG